MGTREAHHCWCWSAPLHQHARSALLSGLTENRLMRLSLGPSDHMSVTIKRHTCCEGRGSLSNAPKCTFCQYVTVPRSYLKTPQTHPDDPHASPATQLRRRTKPGVAHPPSQPLYPRGPLMRASARHSRPPLACRPRREAPASATRRPTTPRSIEAPRPGGQAPPQFRRP